MSYIKYSQGPWFCRTSPFILILWVHLTNNTILCYNVFWMQNFYLVFFTLSCWYFYLSKILNRVLLPPLVLNQSYWGSVRLQCAVIPFSHQRLHRVSAAALRRGAALRDSGQWVPYGEENSQARWAKKRCRDRQKSRDSTFNSLIIIPCNFQNPMLVPDIVDLAW